MIATWMIYCALCALGLSVAALLAERALLRGRGPVRLVWVGAVALSIGIPAAALRVSSRSPAPAPSLGAGDPVAASDPSPSDAAMPPTAKTPTSPGWGATL